MYTSEAGFSRVVKTPPPTLTVSKSDPWLQLPAAAAVMLQLGCCHPPGRPVQPVGGEPVSGSEDMSPKQML